MIHAELARMIVDARRRDLEREARTSALAREARAAGKAESSRIANALKVSWAVLRAQ